MIKSGAWQLRRAIAASGRTIRATAAAKKNSIQVSMAVAAAAAAKKNSRQVSMASTSNCIRFDINNATFVRRPEPSASKPSPNNITSKIPRRLLSTTSARFDDPTSKAANALEMQEQQPGSGGSGDASSTADKVSVDLNNAQLLSLARSVPQSQLTVPGYDDIDEFDGIAAAVNEIKDPDLIFKRVISDILAGLDGKRYLLRFPKEILFLAGAPGSGKGTVSACIMRERGLTAPPITASDLLNTPESIKLKKQGKMIQDKEVVEAVFRKLLEPQYESGALVDGFPRTLVQAQCVSKLYDLMLELRREYQNTEHGEALRRPIFRIATLFIDEAESVARQLKRGQKARLHNLRVMQTGVGTLVEERDTDMSEEAARARYKFFKEHSYNSLLTLRDKFGMHFIDASGPIEQVEKNVVKELHYQSALELGSETFDVISKVPLAEEIIRHARQNLVSRLDRYQRKHPEMFQQVVDVINNEFMHIIQRQALAGVAIIRSENSLFSDPVCLNMALDILNERGYQVILDYERKEIPDSIDPATFKIKCRMVKTYHFEIRFQRPKIRDNSDHFH